MSLLVTSVLGDEVEVFSTDDEGSMHFGGDDSAGEDATTDRYHAGEGTFLVCVVGLRISDFALGVIPGLPRARRPISIADV
jgi:hypothetical protein